jgi:hypothetical protein
MKRLQTVGFVVTIVLVLVLGGSLVVGLRAPAEVLPEPGFDPRVDGDRLRVEVLNGAGVAGLARLATRELRRQNFDVVYFGNAGGEHRDSSLVIDRAGREEDAWKVAQALGIDRVDSQPDTALYLEATVILGREWAERRRASAAEAVSGP